MFFRKAASRPWHQNHGRPPRFEPLEDRRMLALFTVTNLDDIGPGSLRDAISQANSMANQADEIQFQAGLAGSIHIASQLPAITDDLTIVGPGAESLIIDAGDGLDGEFATRDGYRHFLIDDGDNTTARQVAISGLTFTGGDVAFGDGGAIFNREHLVLEQVTIDGNSADDGGAIYHDRENLTIRSSTIANNLSTGNGGGIFSDAPLTIVDSIITGNSIDRYGRGGFGGGIFNTSSLLLTQSVVADNSAEMQGGGIYNGRQGTDAIIQASTISNNSAYEGGGIHNTRDATLLLEQTTLSSNKANLVGGGLLNGGAATITGSTIVFNTVRGPYGPGFQGGGIDNHGDLELNNSIVAGNLSGGDINLEFLLSHASGSHNFIGDGSGLEVFENTTTGDPLLGPLTDNGGPTPTHAPLPGSLAINRGNPAIGFDPAEFDQRGEGFPRVHDGRVDIGAVETPYTSPVLPTSLVVTVADGAFNGNWDANDLSLAEAMAAANLTPGADSISFDTVMFATPQTVEIGRQLPVISEELTITGPGAELLTIDAGIIGSSINLDFEHRHFLVDDGQPDNQIAVEISDLTLTGGGSSGLGLTRFAGGSVYNREDLRLSRVVLIDNGAAIGGGIFNEGTLYVSNSAFTTKGVPNWLSSSNGGGLYNSGIATIYNSTFSNLRGSNGSAILNSGTIDIVSSTLAGNRSGLSSGTIHNSGLATLTGTIVANYNHGVDLWNTESGSFSGNYNLISDGSYLDSFTNTLSGDPLLGPLADHGGPTPTMALLLGSPALDAGDPAVLFAPDAFDQRGIGFSRVLDGGGGTRVDIGAYESQGIPAYPLADYNHDGIASLADYTVWRDNLGSTTELASDGNQNELIDETDYTEWRENFGNTLVPVTPVATLALAMDEAFAMFIEPEIAIPRTSSLKGLASAKFALTSQYDALLLAQHQFAGKRQRLEPTPLADDEGGEPADLPRKVSDAATEL